MKVLRLKLFQETACYKKPFAFKVGETYPLPPYSTVKGMLHALLAAKQFIPMRLSIQGNYDTKIVDYQTHSFYKKQDVAELPLVMDGVRQQPEHVHITRMPLYVHLLYRVELILHVAAEMSVLCDLAAAFETNQEFLSLGRREDLVRIDEYALVEAGHEEESVFLEHNAYLPVQQIPSKISYVPYRLNWTYEIRHGIRQWDKIDVGYVQAGPEIDGEEVLLDSDHIPVFLHLEE